MNLTIEFSNEAELLSKTIDDREKMERFGSRVFINLLDGLAELSKLKIIHRYLSPSSIYVSEDYSRLKFFEFSNAIVKNCPNGIKRYDVMPYSLLESKEVSDNHRKTLQCDFWSVGVVMLEIVVGHKMVQNIMRVSDIERVMSSIEEYIAKEVFELIDDLLFHPDCL